VAKEVFAMNLKGLEPRLDLRRAAERFATRIDWLDSRHSFSFGRHYDPDNTHHGLLLVSNDDVVQPGSGFSTHPHRDMEIVTWVLDGELEHQDSEGHRGLIVPGDAQRMSAGQGILHSEINNSSDSPVRFVQMWVMPDTQSLAPGYEEKQIGHLVAKGGLVPIASGRGHDSAIRIHQRHATLWAAKLGPGEQVTLPGALYGHLYVARGPVVLEGAGRLEQGDAARLTAQDDLRLQALPEAGLAEVLYWEFQP
jgi:redox-sensitive bicupin YhaK (pirin superfamily)